MSSVEHSGAPFILKTLSILTTFRNPALLMARPTLAAFTPFSGYFRILLGINQRWNCIYSIPIEPRSKLLSVRTRACMCRKNKAATLQQGCAIQLSFAQIRLHSRPIPICFGIPQTVSHGDSPITPTLQTLQHILN